MLHCQSGVNSCKLRLLILLEEQPTLCILSHTSTCHANKVQNTVGSSGVTQGTDPKDVAVPCQSLGLLPPGLCAADERARRTTAHILVGIASRSCLAEYKHLYVIALAGLPWFWSCNTPPATPLLQHPCMRDWMAHLWQLRAPGCCA